MSNLSHQTCDLFRLILVDAIGTSSEPNRYLTRSIKRNSFRDSSFQKDRDTTPGRDRTDSNSSLLQPPKSHSGKTAGNCEITNLFWAPRQTKTRKIFLFPPFWARRIKIHKMYCGAGLWVKRLYTYSTGCTCSGLTLALARKTCRQLLLSGPPVVDQRNPQGCLTTKPEDLSWKVEGFESRLPAKDHSNRSLLSSCCEILHFLCEIFKM